MIKKISKNILGTILLLTIIAGSFSGTLNDYFSPTPRTIEDMTYPINRCLVSTVNQLMRYDIRTNWNYENLSSAQTRYWETTRSECSKQFEIAYLTISLKFEEKNTDFLEGYFDGITLASQAYVISFVKENYKLGALGMRDLSPFRGILLPDGKLARYDKNKRKYDMDYLGLNLRSDYILWNNENNICDNTFFQNKLQLCLDE